MKSTGLCFFVCLLIAVAFPSADSYSRTVFTVTNTNDSGAGSLRQAILDANTAAGTDTIDFNIAGNGPHTISPLSGLPEVTETVCIRGDSQPGAIPANANSPATIMIELDGSNAGDDTHGLVLNANECIITGLIINRFGRSGIVIVGSFCTIQGNYIGTDVSGTQALGNGFRSTDGFPYDAIWIDNSAFNQVGSTIPAGRNLLSANGEAGVFIGGSNATNNAVQGNYIGTDSSRTQALGNGFDGVILDADASNNLIGGTPNGAGNLISGNLGSGVFMSDNSGPNRVQGNYIGTDKTGTQPVGNASAGIVIINGSDNLIGGTDSGAGNLISANGEAGVGFIDGGGNNIVQGNLIGTDVSGTEGLGNSGDGVFIRNSKKNLIGGTSSGARNVISDNAASGIGIESTEASLADSNIVQGNYIGLDVSGTQALGNGANGVGTFNTSHNLVGGTGPGAGNIISANGGTGVRFARDPGGLPANGNVVQGNYIGTDVSGANAFGNQFDGVSLSNSSNNLIGGSSEGASNVMADHGFAGVFLTGAETSNNTVQGNYIGIDASGTGLLPNSDSGVDIFLAENNLIGGTEDGAANIIAGNQKSGVAVRLSSTSSEMTTQQKTGPPELRGARISAKRIAGRKSRVMTGANLAGSERLFISAMSNGTDRGVADPNSISKNSANRAPGDGNAIRRNIMFDNVELGIDLASVARGNDSDDSDSGENKGQNYPEILMATGDEARLSVDYLVSSSTTNSAYPLEVEFFIWPAQMMRVKYISAQILIPTQIQLKQRPSIPILN